MRQVERVCGICSSVLHAKLCSTCKDAGSLAGAVDIKAEVSWRNVPDGWSTSLLNAASAKRRGLDRLNQQTVEMLKK